MPSLKQETRSNIYTMSAMSIMFAAAVAPNHVYFVVLEDLVLAAAVLDDALRKITMRRRLQQVSRTELSCLFLPF